jgi:hypothetical protein
VTDTVARDGIRYMVLLGDSVRLLTHLTSFGAARLMGARAARPNRGRRACAHRVAEPPGAPGRVSRDFEQRASVPRASAFSATESS